VHLGYKLAHHLDSLSPAERLVHLSLGQVVFGPLVSVQLDGSLVRGLLLAPALVPQLLGQQLLKVAQVSSCPLVAGIWEIQPKITASHFSWIPCNIYIYMGHSTELIPSQSFETFWKCVFPQILNVCKLYNIQGDPGPQNQSYG